MIKLTKSKSLRSNHYSFLRVTFLWILISLSALSLNAANKDFEGEISYKITYEDGLGKQVMDVLPIYSTLLIKNYKFYSYTNGPLGNQGLIYYHQKKVSYSLVDLFTTALAIKKVKADMKKDRELYKTQNIQFTEETKTILGYTCRKVIVTVYIPRLKRYVDLVAFYTRDLGNTEWINETDPIYYEIRGTLLEYDIQMGSVFMTFKATSVKHLKMSESDFKIPNTHRVVSPKEAEAILKNK